jgi:AcrR family transcriptional regulator
MPRKPGKKPPPSPPRKRRTAEDARTAILDAAERHLVASGPAGIRLQEVAADVGVSHPTVLHHFGSREALVEAVVGRALDSLHAGLLGAVSTTSPGPDHIAMLLERVSGALVSGGHARAFLWLTLSGYTTSMDELRIRSLAEAVHELRCARARNSEGIPTLEDTYFTVMLPALALLAASAIAMPTAGGPRRRGRALQPCSLPALARAAAPRAPRRDLRRRLDTPGPTRGGLPGTNAGTPPPRRTAIDRAPAR